MTPKHTQGPWSFDPEDKSIVGKDEGLSIATIDNIDVGGDKGFHFGEESEANARLIAAAPDLMEALKSCRDALYWVIEQAGGAKCEHEGNVCFCKENNAIFLAVEAINYAEGNE